jgi:hypothetical protein
MGKIRRVVVAALHAVRWVVLMHVSVSGRDHSGIRAVLLGRIHVLWIHCHHSRVFCSIIGCVMSIPVGRIVSLHGMAPLVLRRLVRGQVMWLMMLQ